MSLTGIEPYISFFIRKTVSIAESRFYQFGHGGRIDRAGFELALFFQQILPFKDNPLKNKATFRSNKIIELDTNSRTRY